MGKEQSSDISVSRYRKFGRSYVETPDFVRYQNEQSEIKFWGTGANNLTLSISVKDQETDLAVSLVAS
jgi:hypothetical protein